MGKFLNEEEIKAAELAISHCFEKAGVKKLQALEIIQFAKALGAHRTEIKEARKRLGVTSKKEDGAYWWEWSGGAEPGDVRRQKSEEWMERCGKMK